MAWFIRDGIVYQSWCGSIKMLLLIRDGGAQCRWLGELKMARLIVVEDVAHLIWRGSSKMVWLIHTSSYKKPITELNV